MATRVDCDAPALRGALDVALPGADHREVAHLLRQQLADSLIGEKIVLNEFVAFIDLGAMNNVLMLGIGVNVNQTREQLPPDAQTEPTSLRVELGERDNMVVLASSAKGPDVGKDLSVLPQVASVLAPGASPPEASGESAHAGHSAAAAPDRSAHGGCRA